MDVYEQFLSYNYPETKDLCLHFLTLVTGVLVFSLNFAEKVFLFKDASSRKRVLIISSWCSFIVSIIFCGIGIAFNSRAGGYAVTQQLTLLKEFSFYAYLFIFSAGILFVLGLILTIISAVLSNTKIFKP